MDLFRGLSRTSASVPLIVITGADLLFFSSELCFPMSARRGARRTGDEAVEGEGCTGDEVVEEGCTGDEAEWRDEGCPGDEAVEEEGCTGDEALGGGRLYGG